MTTAEPPSLTVAAAKDQFFAARRSLQDSPHTTAAHRRDLTAIVAIDVDTIRADVDGLSVDQLSGPVLVGEDVLPGNPMAAVLPPRRGMGKSKPLQGEDTPETLLRSAALPRRNARDPWPQRGLAILATLRLSGLRSAELLTLQIGSVTGAAGERRIRVVGKEETTMTPLVNGQHIDRREHGHQSDLVGAPPYSDRLESSEGGDDGSL